MEMIKQVPGVKPTYRKVLRTYRSISRTLEESRLSLWPYYIPLPMAPVRGPRYFCQNAGACGSVYIIKLLMDNKIPHYYHEKKPDLDLLGIAHFEDEIDKADLIRLLINTRRKVFFEANNRLFSMTKELKEAFPDARFIHLHRDPKGFVPSALSLPPDITWKSGRRRYESTKINGPIDGTMLEKACYYWATMNQRILDDLEGEEFLSLKFTDLIEGNVEPLAEFIEMDLPIKKRPPANSTKPRRKEGKYPAFEDWNAADQATLMDICGATMRALGYE